MLKANTIDEVSLEVVTSLYYCGWGCISPGKQQHTGFTYACHCHLLVLTISIKKDIVGVGVLLRISFSVFAFS